MNEHSSQIVLFIDSVSAPSSQANRSSFSFQMSPALTIPPGAGAPILKVVEADIVYTSSNVSAAKSNNKLEFQTWTNGSYGLATHTSHSLRTHTILFEDGLYSLEQIRQEVIAYCQRTIHIEDNALDILSNTATQKVIMSYNAESQASGILFKWSAPDSIGSLLGFTSDDFVDYFEIATPENHYDFTADKTANFDSLEHFLIHFDKISGNYGATGSGSQAAAAVVPDNTEPGSTIHYRPIHPLPCDASQLRGTTSSIFCSVTDQAGDEVVLKENWSARVVLSW
jgi:hypothetical protein